MAPGNSVFLARNFQKNVTEQKYQTVILPQHFAHVRSCKSTVKETALQQFHEFSNLEALDRARVRNEGLLFDSFPFCEHHAGQAASRWTI